VNTGHDDDGTFDRAYDDGFGPDGAEGLQLPPWERRSRYGVLNALYLTIKDVLLAPQRFFHRMPTRVGLVQPLIFAIVIGVVGSFFAWMWSLAGSSLKVLLSDDLSEVFSGPLRYFVMFLFSPLIVTLLVFLRAGVTHGALVLFGGNRLGFEATFRVVAYSEAASILALVPLCGQVVAMGWSIVVTIIGLYAIHESEPWRAMLAVLLPMLLCLAALGAGMAGLIVGMV